MLTTKSIIAARPKEKPFAMSDKGHRGLSLHVASSGKKTFLFRYEWQGKQRSITLGEFPSLSLADARGQAEENRGKVRQGVDPRAKKTEPEESESTTTGDEISFSEAVSDYAKRYCARHVGEASAKEYERVLRKEFVSVWGERDIRTISKKEAVDQIEEIYDRPQVLKDGSIKREISPSAANHACTNLKMLFNWCFDEDIIENNVMGRLKKPAKAHSRTRILDDDELVAVWNAAGEMNFPYRDIVRLMITTLQRRGEVTGLVFAELDTKTKLWSLPAERNKGKRDHFIPLNAMSMEILEGLPRIHQTMLFPSNRTEGKYFSGWSKSKAKLNGLCGVEGWVLHDLRRTASTGLGGLGTDENIIKRILNHSPENVAGVTGIYNRHQYLAEKAQALELWSDHLRELIAKKTMH